jgi:hypothetical protein
MSSDASFRISLFAVMSPHPSTQNQALNAIRLLYRNALGVQLPWIEGVQRAKNPRSNTCWQVWMARPG